MVRELLVLDNLSIRKIAYGDNEGRYLATVEYAAGGHAKAKSIKITLPPDLTDKVLKMFGDYLVEQSKEMAQSLIVDQIECQVKQIEAKETMDEGKETNS